MTNKTTNLLLAFSISIIAIILGEIFLKSFFPLPVSNDHNKIFCQYDSLLGWVKIPNHQGYHITTEYRVKEQFNSKGLRGPEYQYLKSKDEKRILILGDSFAEGYMVEYDDLFSELLKHNLNKTSLNRYYYEVINTGTGGYSTDQEFLFLKNEGYKYQPDLVILMFYMNDVDFNDQAKYWRGFKPKFELIGDSLILTNVPVPKLDMSSEEQNQSLIKKIKQWSGRNIEIYKRAKNIRDKTRRLTRTKQEAIKEIPNEFLLFSKQKNNITKPKWKITEALISGINSFCKSINSELLIFYVPHKAAVYEEDWLELKNKYDFDDELYSADSPQNELQYICNKLDLNYMNPTQAIVTEAKLLKESKERLYYINDGHWNAKGNKLISNLLTEYISANLSLDKHTDTIKTDVNSNN